MKYLKLLLAPALALLILACEKNDQLETQVSGRIVTYNTDNFPGDTALPVELGGYVASGGLNAAEEIRQTTYTDDNGRFSFSFTADYPGDAWFIRLPYTHTPSLHYDQAVSGGIPVKIGEAQNINIKLKPMAWVELHVKNVNSHPGDLLSVNWGGGDSPNFYGAANDTIILKGGGDFFKSFPLNLFRNNEWHNFKDSVYLPAFDTTYHLLEY